MKISILKYFLLFLVLNVLSFGAYATSGIFQTYAIINANATGNQFLAGGINSDGAPVFSGVDFGAVTSLSLSGGEMKTFKNSGSDVFGAELYYNVHLSSGATGAFTLINLPFNADLGGGDQKWQQAAAGLNLLTGLSCGTYDIEVFWKITGTDPDQFDSNGGANFTATFTILDTTPPTITCPANVTVDADAGLCTASGVDLGAATATDNCSTVGNSLKFDGVNDFVQGPTSVIPTSGEYTVTLWAKEIGPTTVLKEVFAVNASCFFGHWASGLIRVSTSWNPSVPFPTDNQWHHYAIVRKTADTELYIDGVLVASKGSSIPVATANTLYIGRQFPPYNENFNGSIDAFHVWDYARTGTQIAGSMNAQINAETGLVASYSFDQGFAGGDNSSPAVNTLIDASGNGNDGTLNNFALSGSDSNWAVGNVSNVAINNDAPSAFPAGVTTVTWTATDAAGNSATCTQTVTVEDNEAPTVTCPSDIEVFITYSESGAVVNFSASASDNCDAIPVVTYSQNPGTTFSVGTTTVTCSTMDAAGNPASCQFNVTVTQLADNEDCTDAIGITPSVFGEPAWETFALGASESMPGCIGDADDDVWFRFTATSANDIIIAQDPAAGYDAVIELFTSCGGTSLGCSNAYGAGAIERYANTALTPGTEYFFRVYDAATGASASTDVRVMVKTFEDCQLYGASCGMTATSLSQSVYAERDNAGQLYANPVVGVFGYGFRFQEQGGGLDVTIQQPTEDGFYIQLANAGLEYGKTYDVSVQHLVGVPVNGSLFAFWSGFGTVCTVTMGPAPTATLRPQFCAGTTDYYLADQIQSVYMYGATQYRFTFAPSLGGAALVKNSNNYGVYLHTVGSTGNRLQYGQSYVVTVEALIAGTWTTPGAPCTIFMQTQPEDTGVRAQYCNGTYLYPNSNFILAETVYGATYYEWRFEPSVGMAQTQITNGVSLAFHLTSMMLQSGVTYNVSVRAFAGGVVGDYGASCPITIQANPGVESQDNDQAKMLTPVLEQLDLYPNPNDGDEVMIIYLSDEVEEGMMTIELMDILGRPVQKEVVSVKGAEVRYKLRFEESLPSGVYFLKLTRDGKSATERLIIR